jgi:hypothetical protein
MLKKKWNLSFTGLNIALGAFAFASLYYRYISILGIFVAVIFIMCWMLSKHNKKQFYQSFVKTGRIEGEISVYSSFAVWISVYVSALSSQNSHSYLNQFFSIVAVIGVIGWSISLLPLTKLFGKD